MFKKIYIILVIFIITVCIFLCKFLDRKYKSSMEYSTSIKEINKLLNDESSNFKSIVLHNDENSIYLNTDKRKIEFKKYALLKDINKQQINYKSENNFISILKIDISENIIKNINLNQFNFNDKQGYYIDEFNNPISSLNYDNEKILYCNNLKNDSSRNYFYYDIYYNKIKISFTRANEIYFWYNNSFYYIGTDLNLKNTEIIELVTSIIREV